VCTWNVWTVLHTYTLLTYTDVPRTLQDNVKRKCKLNSQGKKICNVNGSSKIRNLRQQAVRKHKAAITFLHCCPVLLSYPVLVRAEISRSPQAEEQVFLGPSTLSWCSRFPRVTADRPQFRYPLSWQINVRFVLLKLAFLLPQDSSPTKASFPCFARVTQWRRNTEPTLTVYPFSPLYWVRISTLQQESAENRSAHKSLLSTQLDEDLHIIFVGYIAFDTIYRRNIASASVRCVSRPSALG
jgi:hypothetical protein